MKTFIYKVAHYIFFGDNLFKKPRTISIISIEPFNPNIIFCGKFDDPIMSEVITLIRKPNNYIIGFGQKGQNHNHEGYNITKSNYAEHLTRILMDVRD